jgi:hypothetical protein
VGTNAIEMRDRSKSVALFDFKEEEEKYMFPIE